MIHLLNGGGGLRGESPSIGVHCRWRWQRLVTSRRQCQGGQGLSYKVHRGLRRCSCHSFVDRWAILRAPTKRPLQSLSLRGGGGSGGRANLSPTCRSSCDSWYLRLIDNVPHGRQYTCVALPSRCSYNATRVSFPRSECRPFVASYPWPMHEVVHVDQSDTVMCTPHTV